MLAHQNNGTCPELLIEYCPRRGPVVVVNSAGDQSQFVNTAQAVFWFSRAGKWKPNSDIQTICSWIIMRACYHVIFVMPLASCCGNCRLNWRITSLMRSRRGCSDLHSCGRELVGRNLKRGSEYGFLRTETRPMCASKFSKREYSLTLDFGC